MIESLKLWLNIFPARAFQEFHHSTISTMLVCRQPKNRPTISIARAGIYILPVLNKKIPHTNVAPSRCFVQGEPAIFVCIKQKLERGNEFR